MTHMDAMLYFGSTLTHRLSVLEVVLTYIRAVKKSLWNIVIITLLLTKNHEKYQ